MARARAPSQVAGPRQIWDLPTPVTAGELLLPFGALARELAGRDVSSTFGRSRAVVIDPARAPHRHSDPAGAAFCPTSAAAGAKPRSRMWKPCPGRRRG